MYCCTCSGCGPKVGNDGTRGCTRCITSTVKPTVVTTPVQVHYNRNGFTNIHGKPQVTYKRD